RTPWAFEARHRRVGVDADEQDIAQCARGLQITDVTDVQQVEAAVGEDDPLAVGSKAVGELRRLRDRQLPPIDCRSSVGVTVAVPRFMTTMPPAMLASVAASRAGAPHASASVNTLMTVSPAPVTSAISSVPWTGMNVVAPSRSSSAMPRLPRVT